MVQTIDIGGQGNPTRPTVRLVPSPPGTVWQYTGSCHEGLRAKEQAVIPDLNRASQDAAFRLAQKVSTRNVEIELVIDPALPPLTIADEVLAALVTAIAENASASVEPGPGLVSIRTWWKDKYVGVDAIGVGGRLPAAVRDNIASPGFSTRVADWDTGFGLYDAMETAASIGGKIELFDSGRDVGFRLQVPVKAKAPASPPELALILPNGSSGAGNIMMADKQSMFMVAEQEDAFPYMRLNEPIRA